MKSAVPAPQTPPVPAPQTLTEPPAIPAPPAPVITINQSAPGFKDLRWVALAVAGKDYAGEALQCISIEFRRVIATDSHRVHQAEVETDIEPGLYRVIKRLKTSLQLQKEPEDIRYPDTDSVWPDLEAITPVELEHVDYEPGHPYKPERRFIPVAQVIRAMKGNAINVDFIIDTLPMEKVYPPENPAVGVTFTKDNRKALVMPIRWIDK